MFHLADGHRAASAEVDRSLMTVLGDGKMAGAVVQNVNRS